MWGYGNFKYAYYYCIIILLLILVVSVLNCNFYFYFFIYQQVGSAAVSTIPDGSGDVEVFIPSYELNKVIMQNDIFHYIKFTQY